jgi:hypothetical protein
MLLAVNYRIYLHATNDNTLLALLFLFWLTRCCYRTDLFDVERITIGSIFDFKSPAAGFAANLLSLQRCDTHHLIQ